jgi:hypothetical protein
MSATRMVSAPAPSVVKALAPIMVAVLLGGAESFIITGATTWGPVCIGAHNAGKVIAWTGTAKFAAFAAGAPLGTILYNSGGFGLVAAATAATPLATLFLIAPLRPIRAALASCPWCAGSGCLGWALP